MPRTDSDTINLSASEAAEVATSALLYIGLDDEESETIAAHLVDCELMGYPALGLSRVLTIAEYPLTRQPRSPITITHETPVSARIDGGNHIGMYAIRWATEIAIDKAKAEGFALVGARNSFLSGRNAYYLDLIAEAGFVGLHLASGKPVVAPLGGAASAFGTNPIAFGMPHKPHPLIFDFATSATNYGALILASRLGHDLPEGVAIDADGQPTRDPVATLAALAGAILPLGGYKGSALSFAIQALGLLGGAALTHGESQDFGFLFIVFDPSLLMPAAAFQVHLDDLIARVKATPRLPGFEEIRIPSERAYAERERRRVDGIDLPLAIYDQVKSL